MSKFKLIFFLLLFCSRILSQSISTPPSATERLGGDILYFEETTYNMWNLRLSSGNDRTTQAIKRPESITCHLFDARGNEIVTTRYVQRDANVGSIGMDNDGRIDFIANEISRVVPDERTVRSYDTKNRLVTTRTWSYNLGDSTLVLMDSCIYDSTGTLCGITMVRDSVPLSGRYQKQDRNGSYSITYDDGTSESYRYDSDYFLVRYRDREGRTVKYFYNEHGNNIRQSSEWDDGSSLNVIFDDFEYDESGNWVRCIRNVKDPGMPSRSTKIIGRTYTYLK